jgi:hypothetical protein
LGAHTNHLLEQVDAHEAGDYVASFAIGRQAHEHMGAVSNLLATGIANQFPARFLPDTGVGNVIEISVLGWLAVGVAGALTVRAAWARRSRTAIG